MLRWEMFFLQYSGNWIEPDENDEYNSLADEVPDLSLSSESATSEFDVSFLASDYFDA